jgi:lysophospholipase L1-like esterase
MTRSPTAPADRSAALVLALALVLTGCGPTAPVADPIYYVSIGDSYATGDGPNGTPRDGFAYLTENTLQQNDNAGWRLVNFGCAGATAQQMAHRPGCDADARADGGPDYPDVPQVDAAVRFLAEHRDQVGLVTVVAGGNDVAPCIAEVASGGALACAESATASTVAAVDEMLGKLGGVLDADVPVIGVSYLNVFLAGEHADISATVFDDTFNPSLRQTYSSSGARFADSPAGSAADICALSYWCSDHDVHPNRAGHQRIADAILGKLVDS